MHNFIWHPLTLSLIVATIWGVGFPSPASAAGFCPLLDGSGNQTYAQKDASASNAEPQWLRKKLAPLAPSLRIHLWVAVRAQREDKAPIRDNALVMAPLPVKRGRQIQQPFGWEISLSWNLVDIADAIFSDHETTVGRLRASNCPLVYTDLTKIAAKSGWYSALLTASRRTRGGQP